MLWHSTSDRTIRPTRGLPRTEVPSGVPGVSPPESPPPESDPLDDASGAQAGMTTTTPVGADLDPALCSQILESCGSFNLRKASRAVSQLYDTCLQPCGLRSTQLALLTMLAAEPRQSAGELARRLVVSSSTLSRNLGPLERDGLVERVVHPGRGRALRLTPIGEQRLVEAVPLWRAAQEKFTELVGAQAWGELNRRLAAAVQATRS